MKQFAISVAAALILAACAAPVQENEVQIGPYTVTAISENVYHIQDCNDSNPSGETYGENGEKTHFNNCSDMYLLVGGKKSLLIDLSNNVQWADNAAESLRSIVYDRAGKKPLTITFTHNHGDHTGMLPAFIDDEKAFFALPETDFKAMAERFPEGRYEFYNEGFKFDLGGMTVSTVAVPGHTAGSMVFFLDGQNLAFSGDAIGSGHGVWLFDRGCYDNYLGGLVNLVSYIENPANGIDQKALKFYGGHFWQKDWFPEMGDDVFGMEYLRDMQQLVLNIADGSAETEASNLNVGALDTYFKFGKAIIVWNAAQAEQFRADIAQ